jgi:hypothetical protein
VISDTSPAWHACRVMHSDTCHGQCRRRTSLTTPTAPARGLVEQYHRHEHARGTRSRRGGSCPERAPRSRPGIQGDKPAMATAIVLRPAANPRATASCGIIFTGLHDQCPFRSPDGQQFFVHSCCGNGRHRIHQHCRVRNHAAQRPHQPQHAAGGRGGRDLAYFLSSSCLS